MDSASAARSARRPEGDAALLAVCRPLEVPGEARPKPEPDHPGPARHRGHRSAQLLDARALGVSQVQHVVGTPQVAPRRLRGGPDLAHAIAPPGDAVKAELEGQAGLVRGRARSRPGVHGDERTPRAVGAAVRRRRSPSLHRPHAVVIERQQALVPTDQPPGTRRRGEAGAHGAIRAARELHAGRAREGRAAAAHGARQLNRHLLGGATLPSALVHGGREEGLHDTRVQSRHGVSEAQREDPRLQPWIRRGHPEGHHVLPGQVVGLAGELEAAGRHLAKDLGLAHLVPQLDGDGSVLGAELHEHHLTARPQRLTDVAQHSHRVRELVVDVHHQHDVAGALREPRVIHRRLHVLEVLEALVLCPLPQEHQHLGLQVDGEDPARRAHIPRQRQGVVAVAAPQITDRIPRRRRQPRAQRRTVLFVLPGLSQEPGSARPVHGPRDPSTEVFAPPFRRSLGISSVLEGEGEEARGRAGESCRDAAGVGSARRRERCRSRDERGCLRM